MKSKNVSPFNGAGCDVCVYTHPEAAGGREGIEYQDSPEHINNFYKSNDLQNRIEEKMHQIWYQVRSWQAAKKRRKQPAIVA